MKVLVPLAGPDFERADGTLKSEQLVDVRSLLEATLQDRPWWRTGLVSDADIVFVLKGSQRTREYAEGALRSKYPRSQNVLLSTWSGGAALSALAGVSLLAQFDEPLCIDLVDISYNSTFAPEQAFADSRVGAVGLAFESSNPQYSYLKTDENGYVVETAEKKVISQHASAGTYFFASPSLYISALAHNLQNSAKVTYNGLFYVCPVFNGVVAAGRMCLLESVTEIRDIKIHEQ